MQPFTFLPVRRGSARYYQNLDHTWVTLMIDRVTAPLRREVGLPPRQRERAINRKEEQS